MRRSSLFVLVFIMALSAFSVGVGISYAAAPFLDDETEAVEGAEEEEEEAVENFTADDVMYHVTEEGVVEVDGVEDGATGITIPKEVKYEDETYQVTTITEDAFKGCSGLKTVEIACDIERIDKNLFLIACV